MTTNPPLTDAERALDRLVEKIPFKKGEVNKVGGDMLKDYLCVRTALKQADKARGLVEALEKIAKRPNLPNPERDADWKSCMKWSAHEAQEALTTYQSEAEGK